jgi:peptidyl-prolyl cis-trans isomerase D
MLTYFRKHSKGWLAYTAFGAIIVVFVLWGGSSYLSREASMVAKIDRHIISVEQFSKAYTDQLKMYQDRYGNALTPEMLKKLDLKKTVLDQLIDDYIIEVDAKKMGIGVTDSDLQQTIAQVPAFNKEGKFDEAIYRRYLDYERLTPAEFELKLSKDVLKQRFVNVLTENVTVPRYELEATFHYMNDSFELAYITIDSAAFAKDVQVDQNQARSYFDTNKDRYKLQPKITLAAIEYPAAGYLASTQVTKEEALDYYQSHITDFSNPAKFHVRNILIKITEEADANMLAQKEQLIKKILAEANAGKDFAALAAQYSQDEQTAKKGGDMGMLPREGYPQGVGEVLESMKPGEVKGPVRSSQGIHILKLEGKEEKKAIPFEKLETTVTDTLRLQRAKITARAEAEKAFMQLYEQSKPDLDAFAKANNLIIKHVGPFSEGQDSGLSMSPEAIKKAFTFQTGELGEVASTPVGFLIYMVTKKEPSRIPDLKEVADRVMADIRAKTTIEKAKEYAKKLAAESPEQLNAQNPGTTGEFTRAASAVPKLSMIPKIIDDLESLKSPKVFENMGTVYLVWIKSKKTADIRAIDKKQNDMIMRQLLMKKQELTLKSYLEQAKDEKKGWHKVVKNEGNVDEGGTGGRKDRAAPSDFN